MYRTDAATGAGLESSDRPGPRARIGARAVGAKRTMDVLAAAALLLIFLPVLFGIACAVAASLGLPVIYSQARVGRRGRIFKIYKFRSMRKDADLVLTEFLESSPSARLEWDRYHKLRDDPRVTTFGRFLRASSLDELPQLWNVLKGDMSLIGPRPVTLSERHRYGKDWAAYCAMRPGITGLWQVNGRNSLTYDQRVAYDIQYVEGWSARLDAKILLKTILVVLRRHGSM